jgi:hypothetical protein
VHRIYQPKQVLSEGRLPLSRIDQIVDSAAGSDITALLDCFSGYHQIWLHREDEEKTNFITPFHTYCYLRTLEVLCNAGPTFYIIMNEALKGQEESFAHLRPGRKLHQYA